jgi:hypothetical protein
MRWLLGVVAALVLVASAWLGSAGWALSGLASAARTGNGAEILARTDLPALKRSLTEQIVTAALARIGESRPIKPMEKMIASTYGSSIADALLTKLLTADNLTELLRSGRISQPGAPALTGLPALGQLDIDVSSVLGRFRFISPATIGIRLDDSPDPAAATEIELHRELLDWKLAGLNLPKATVRDLAAQLPVK